MSYTWCPEAYRVADPASACFDPALSILSSAAILGAMLLSVAAAQDLLTRNASNAYWILMLVPAVATVWVAPMALVTGLAGVGVGVALYVGGLGGADMKAVVVSAFLFPDPLLWLGLVSCAVIGMGVWLALGHRRAPFLVALASSVGLGLWSTGIALYGIPPSFV